MRYRTYPRQAGRQDRTERRLSETVENMARALFKSWFIDFDRRAKAERAIRLPNSR